MFGCLSRIAFNLVLVAYFLSTFGFVLVASKGLELKRIDGVPLSDVPFWAKK